MQVPMPSRAREAGALHCRRRRPWPERRQPVHPTRRGRAAQPPPAVPPKPAMSRRVDSAEAMRAPARENLPLFMKVAEATGNEVQLTGEESVTLPDGTVRFDKGKYPVIYNAVLRQKVVIDPDGKIPASLKAKLNDPRIGTPVVPMADGLTVAEAVRQLLISI